MIELLAKGLDLTAAEIELVVERLTSAEVDEETKADFLCRLRAKGESAAEIAGFAEAMLRRSIDPGLDRTRLPGPLIDLCGTGGDRSDLFNVSTTSMFVVAAAGAVVVKHGNRAVTSKCGGADVLEALGVKIDMPPTEFRRCVEEVGVGFLFAPAYHPAFKAIIPVRKRLAAEGRTTIFNILGPLLNPVRPERQIVGIYAHELLPRYAEALAHLGRERAWAVHGQGLDELSTTGPNEVEEWTGTERRRFVLDAQEFGFPRSAVEELRGGDCERNAAVLTGILGGELRGPMADMVVLNSGAALHVAGVAADLVEGFALAREQIESGRALGKLRALRELTARA